MPTGDVESGLWDTHGEEEREEDSGGLREPARRTAWVSEAAKGVAFVARAIATGLMTR